MKKHPLLLVHGYPFDHTMWFSTIAALGAQAKVLVPDLPGFGRADLPAGKKPSIDTMADSLLDLLNLHEVEKAIVCGMSMGGYVALAFAERHRIRLAGLGLISSQAAADTPEAREGRKETIRRIRADGPSAAVEGLIPKMFSTRAASNPDLTGYATRGAAAAGVAGLCWALEAMAGRPDRTGVAQDLDLPVLVVHGAEDKIVPGSRARQLAERCLLPIHVEILGAGHATPLEAPDEVAAALGRLITTVSEVEAVKAERRPPA